MTIQSEILEIVTNLPGVTSGQVVELMPHVKAQTVYAGLNSLYIRGKVSREDQMQDGNRRTTYAWSINADGKPPVVEGKVKRASFTPAGAILIEQLNARIAVLEAWKADAIARYPDLAVDPLVLKARQMVAEEIGDTDKAARDAVLGGHRDGTLPMRVALKLLEGAS